MPRTRRSSKAPKTRVELRKSPRRNEPRAPALRHGVKLISPLRYPGAKRRLSSYIAESLALNDFKPKLLVEPLAGGASVSLELLARGAVEKIALGERDPLVAAFWKLVFTDHEKLLEAFHALPVNVRTWTKLKHLESKKDLDRAVACLYLNRTSFSGILAPSAGPIGGTSQKGEYKIDCRMAPERLDRRIREIAALSDKVAFINAGDWKTTLARARSRGLPASDVFYYFDPPFYQKADRLYRYAFADEDHRALRNTLVRLKAPWLLSYDPAEFIAELYRDHGINHIEFLYSASGSSGRGRMNELVITSLKNVPTQSRVWRSHREWQKDRGTDPRRRPSGTSAPVTRRLIPSAPEAKATMVARA